MLLLPLLLAGCGHEAAKSSAQTEFVMGTLCRIELFDYGETEAGRELYGRLFSRLARLERILSANLETSELSRVNAPAAISGQPVSGELSACLGRALYFAEASQPPGRRAGAFDPSVGPLVKLWDIGGQAPRVPSRAEIDAALALVGWQDVELREAGPAAGGGSVFLKKPGMALDLGAIAKGYAADELVKLLKESGAGSAIIDLGGNIVVYGKNPRQKAGGAWRVAVQNPLDERGSYLGYADVPAAAGEAVSVVTSGVYERYFEAGGVRYHHILDTATGYPVDNGLLSVTVIAEASTDADALSTACFALGYEKGAALAAANSALGIFVFTDKKIRLTGGFGAGGKAQFALTDESFTLSQPAPSQTPGTRSEE